MSKSTIIRPSHQIPQVEPFSSIFLAGPTPREAHVESWRPSAIQILEQYGFNQTVLVPEPFVSNGDYTTQIEWEDAALNAAGVIAFWIPRELNGMPGFTTNVEFGTWMRSGKVVLGSPVGAPKMAYLNYYADQYGIPRKASIEATMLAAIDLLKARANLKSWSDDLSKQLGDK